MRSIWKGNFLNSSLNKISKSSVILRTFLQKKFVVNNGKLDCDFFVKREMVGFKVGEFVFTRKVNVVHKKKKDKDKKKK